jgi:anaerobic selenocysteine-containing dehydrogenase
MSEEKVTYNPCQGWGCHEGCILTTYSKDGKIIRTERTLDPATDDHLGGSMICQKGITSPNLLSVPSKLKYPLKRVGERGEGKFERISWDQALDEIGAKLNEIRAKYGAESVLINNFLAGCPNGFNSLNYLLSLRF